MEIYKLSDQIPEKGERGARRVEDAGGNGGVSPGLTITDLKQGVRNPNRVNVFVDSKFVFSLDVTQVVEYRLKIGKVLTEEELAECKRASEFGKLYQRALEWVLARPRSERELRDYLAQKLRKPSSDTLKPLKPSLWSSGDISEFSSEIVNRLISKGYVDDRKFAEYYLENRMVKKGVSRKRLQMELMKKGIVKEIIDEVLEGRNDEAEARKMIAKKRGKYDDEKLVAYLCRQGFAYSLAKQLVEEVKEG